MAEFAPCLTILTSGWYWGVTMEYPRTMDREGNPVQPDYLRNPPMIQYHPTNFDWVVYDIIPYSYNEYFLPSLYRFNDEEITPTFLCTPQHRGKYEWRGETLDSVDEDIGIFRWHIREYLAKWDPSGVKWIRTKLETKMTPPIPILLDKTRLHQLAQCELLCPTVFIINEPLMTKHCGPRLIVPVLHPNSGYRMMQRPLLCIGHPYGCTLTTHIGYLLMADRSVVLTHFRDKNYEHEFWASCIQKYEKLQKGLDLMSSMDSDYLQPRGREVLMHILTKRVLEMSSHGMEGKVEGVTYPLESI